MDQFQLTFRKEVHQKSTSQQVFHGLDSVIPMGLDIQEFHIKYKFYSLFSLRIQSQLTLYIHLLQEECFLALGLCKRCLADVGIRK